IASRTNQLKLADDVVKKRRRKLKKYISLLRQRSTKLEKLEVQATSSSQQFAGLDKERQMLVEVKKFLETSENEMVTRWATRSGASVAINAAIAVVVLIIASFMAGDRMAQPVWQA